MMFGVFKDRTGTPLMIGDTVRWVDGMGQAYIGVLELPLDYGRPMLRLTFKYSPWTRRWENVERPVTQWRTLEGCGKRRFSWKLTQLELIERKKRRRAAWAKAA